MRTRTKVWLVIAASLVLMGCILFAGVMTSLRWDFRELATVKYETITYEISEAFDSISVNTDTTDIVFAVSDNDKCRVECHEEATAKYSVNVKDSTLTIEKMDERSVYDSIGYIGINFGSPQITVYLPKTEYTTLLIKGTTGDVYLTDIACKSVISNGRTGDISLNNVIVAEKITIERNTGDVNFNRCDAAEIYIKTGTGDVTGSLLSSKVFIANTNTGSVDVPKTVDGGICEIITNTGDIKLEVQ